MPRPMPLELPVIRTFFPWNDIGTSKTAASHVSAPIRDRQCLSTCLSSPHPTPCKYKKRRCFNEVCDPLSFSIDNLVTTLVHYPRKVVRPGPARRFCFKAIFVAPASLPALLSKQAIPKLNSKETFMSSLNPKDRVSLCSFTFSDGRRCRTPRTRNNPRFCAYHAQKEARARTAQKLGKDLAYFFSGDYLSACDLSTALAR